MKKLFLILFIPFILSAQTWIPQGSGYTFTMTLAYATSVAGSDSVETADLDLQYGDMVEIWIKGNSNVSDSIGIRSGAKSILVAGATPSETIYGSFVALKDSNGSIQNTIVNNTVGKHYWLFEPLADVLRFQILNYRAAYPTRSVTLVIKTKRSTKE